MTQSLEDVERVHYNIRTQELRLKDDWNGYRICFQPSRIAMIRAQRNIFVLLEKLEVFPNAIERP